MLLIFIGIAIILIVLGFYFAYKERYSNGRWDFEFGGTIACLIPGFLILIVSIVVYIVLTVLLINLKIVDKKLTVLQENNAQIEEKLYVTLEAYCKHENKTFVEISPENPEVILLIYPELKADSLFESYIDTLKSNNQEIRSLQLEKINKSIYKWWLYFGG